uniref:Uncharacterized protein n=1 Tax=Podoviridae sp. ctZkC8 TaxID=2825259 RepID=A0A8S5UBY3_9CAUD|nr:MAG TPA: hypothetical protein [Podoviridae sp. ctZkC8]
MKVLIVLPVFISLKYSLTPPCVPNLYINADYLLFGKAIP